VCNLWVHCRIVPAERLDKLCGLFCRELHKLQRLLRLLRMSIRDVRFRARRFCLLVVRHRHLQHNERRYCQLRLLAVRSRNTQPKRIH
jgi:hypothetical protein